ncbi:Signal transduction histidine kinase CheA [hydrothermal vent metagenome]|uniref:Chemotaxis protein CheA n=1 Tax=hydrothermal vent metagenome TaxID=652676 RepID=A0A3B1A3A1_9ZZZZ
MTFDMSQFLDTFYDESFEGLQIMENELLNLDVGAADSETINTIFRAAHSIKGGSGTFGLNAVADFTHVMETLLDEMRDGRRDVTQVAVDLLLASVDVLTNMLQALKDGDDLDHEKISSTHDNLEKLLHGEEITASEKKSDSTVTKSNSSKSPEIATSTTDSWLVTFKPHENMLQTGNDPVRILSELSKLGKYNVEVDFSSLPKFNDLKTENCYLSWNITLSGEITEAAIKENFDWVDDECDLSISTGISSKPEEVVCAKENRTEATPNRRAGDRRTATKEAASIRVNIDKVDDLINMVGELVITQSMLSQLGSADSFDQSHIEKMREGLTQLEQHTRELQESVMRIRMMPISFAFQRFPRLVHDLSQTFGKQIELKLSGENTELDKTVMEKIGDPLVHLVRNSLDHGIEAPDIREENGKPVTGTIELNAFHQGGNIVIEIIDDGAGLNKERILNKAIDKGLAKANDFLPDDQIYDMIFRPGFSTAEVVTDVSGRGVGMDVVRRNIRSLGGSIEVRSESGVGSKFTIRLPLTLAILDGQLVRVGGETYIVPLISIIESLQIKPELISGVTGAAEVYKLREEYIPIVRLYQMFDVVPENMNINEGLLVVVEAESKKIAILVDDLLGQQQVVIKSLETNFRKVDGLSGATILGDGTVALIIDITGLMTIYQENRDKPDLKVIDGGIAAA